MATMTRARRLPVQREFEGLVLNGDYYIEWERCDTMPKILTWVLHLSEKTEWVTAQMLHTFVEYAMSYHGLKRDNP